MFAECSYLSNRLHVPDARCPFLRQLSPVRLILFFQSFFKSVSLSLPLFLQSFFKSVSLSLAIIPLFLQSFFKSVSLSLAIIPLFRQLFLQFFDSDIEPFDYRSERVTG